MSIKAVLFDLDGTLLPMDQDIFIKEYLGGLCTTLAPKGYDPRAIASALWKSTDAMVKNDGGRTNETAFWESFCAILGDEVRGEQQLLNEFYKTDFQKIKDVCGYTKRSKELIERLKRAGVKIALATNPLFPSVATENRIRWAGLAPEEFELYTTYENSSFCKPNPKYYLEILEKLGLQPEECAMVGNDVEEDMIAATLGMKVFLLTDCLISRKGTDVSVYPHGDFDDLERFLIDLACGE